MGAVFERRERMRRLAERWGLSLGFTFAGGLYSIDPFDQSGVEQGKRPQALIMNVKKDLLKML